MVKAFALLAVGASALSWDEYKQRFGKTYNGDSEDAQRKQIFESNKKMWGEHESGAVLGATVFSDLSPEEFQQLSIRGFNSGANADLPNLGEHQVTGLESTGAIDWTTRGAVTPVKNQGQCGSCWAFSTTGGLEGAWQISTGNLVSMSEQQFVDCDKGSSGCNGGLMDQAFGWAENQAVATESSYAYTARDGSCKSSFTTAIPRGGVTGYHSVTSASALTSALQSNPVSVAIEADQSVFQQYTGGVIQSGCGTNLDHGVLAVGINSDGSIKVKNSWGSSWGVNGYVNIATNQCGITSDGSYPTVSGSESVEQIIESQGNCDGAACTEVCECAYSKCSSQVNACLADSSCASAQACAFACACGDMFCVTGCTAGTGDLGTAVVQCLSSSCSGDSLLI